MFPDQSSSVSAVSVNEGTEKSRRSNRLESIAYYIFLVTIIISPIVFWPTQYVVTDLVKTFVIAIGTLVSAILYCIVSINERKTVLPPKNILWVGALLALSLIISSLTGIQTMKSLFGEGFEITTASFMLVLFVSVLVATAAIFRKTERALHIYAGATVVFLVLFALQALRLVFGQGFISLSVLTSRTSTLLGSWLDWGTYSILIGMIAMVAIVTLPSSKRIKSLYWIIAALSAVSAFVVDNTSAWMAAFLVLLGLAIYISRSRPRAATYSIGSFLKRLAWIPLLACLVALLFSWKGQSLSAPVVNKINAAYSELGLPWQTTLDVTGGAIKNYPLFGVGPNHFTQAYLEYKPLAIDSTNAWNVEFGYGFGLLPTFVATQGVVGLVLWIMLFVFFGIVGARGLKRLPEDPTARFIMISSYSSTAFVWLVALISVPSHAIIFLSFVTAGIFMGSGIAYGALPGVKPAPVQGTLRYKAMPVILLACAVVMAVWGLVYVKTTAAMSYFGLGVKALTVAGNADQAGGYFNKALAFDTSDTFWRASVEAELAKANQVASTVNTNQATSTATQASLRQIVAILNQAGTFANNAVSYDPDNYYNYISQARVSQAALSISTTTYDNAVKQYSTAIKLDPYDPSLYLNLAKLQVSQNKFTDAEQTVGTALQIKNNYLDAIFLLSQIYAAENNLTDAITAAQVAEQINPQDPQILFQLGLLNYENKAYDQAAQALEAALKVQPGYSNAQYFLGLSYARLNRMSDAVAQFEQLAQNNPDNQEVALILASLKAGKSPFTDAQPPIVPNPEKRPSLPIKQSSSSAKK